MSQSSQTSGLYKTCISRGTTGKRVKEQVSKCADAIRVCFVLEAEDKTYFITLKKQESKDFIVIKRIRGME